MFRGGYKLVGVLRRGRIGGLFSTLLFIYILAWWPLEFGSLHIPKAAPGVLNYLASYCHHERFDIGNIELSHPSHTVDDYPKRA